MCESVLQLTVRCGACRAYTIYVLRLYPLATNGPQSYIQNIRSGRASESNPRGRHTETGHIVLHMHKRTRLAWREKISPNITHTAHIAPHTHAHAHLGARNCPRQNSKIRTCTKAKRNGNLNTILRHTYSPNRRARARECSTPHRFCVRPHVNVFICTTYMCLYICSVPLSRALSPDFPSPSPARSTESLCSRHMQMQNDRATWARELKVQTIHTNPRRQRRRQIARARAYHQHHRFE